MIIGRARANSLPRTPQDLIPPSRSAPASERIHPNAKPAAHGIVRPIVRGGFVVGYELANVPVEGSSAGGALDHGFLLGRVAHAARPRAQREDA